MVVPVIIRFKLKNMKKTDISRRSFIRKSIAAGIAFTGLSARGSGEFVTGLNPMGLPTLPLGKTGVRIPGISIGLGSRFCSVADEDKSLEILTYALDNGLYYWDTANSYIDHSNGVVSEERIGRILKNRRKEIFLSSKVGSREPDEVMRQVEASLERLGTDHFDNLMIHSVNSVDDVTNLSRPGGIIELFSRLKQEGITRFIGFSGHSNANAMKLMIERADFDTVLLAMNQFENYTQQRQELIIPAAAKKNMGILLMKVVRPKEALPDISAAELIRFALSLEGLSSLVLGMDSIGVVKSNIDLLRNFTPMSAEERSTYSQALSSYFQEGKPEWTKPGYLDGHWT
jgi:uncharacterized protein